MKLTEQRMECATCHRVFNGLTNFDKHRTSNYDDPTAPKCVHPSEVGLVDRGGYWGGKPMTDEQKRKAGWL